MPQRQKLEPKIHNDDATSKRAGDAFDGEILGSVSDYCRFFLHYFANQEAREMQPIDYINKNK
jgi:hypothetical protein